MNELKVEGIRIDGHRGFWYVIGMEFIAGQRLFLLEHEAYGDEAPCLIVNARGTIMLADVYNGFDDYREMIEAGSCEQCLKFVYNCICE